MVLDSDETLQGIGYTNDVYIISSGAGRSSHLEREFARFRFNPQEGIIYENIVQYTKCKNGIYMWPVILRKNFQGTILSSTYLNPLII